VTGIFVAIGAIVLGKDKILSIKADNPEELMTALSPIPQDCKKSLNFVELLEVS
jgi:hypothetical protein